MEGILMDNTFIDPVQEKLKEHGVIDKRDTNNPVYVYKFNGVEYKVSLLAVESKSRDWMAGALSKMFKDAIANAIELGRVTKLKSIQNELGIR